MPSPQETEALHTSGVYAKRNLTIVRGKGALVWDDRGREYVDCAAGHGVAGLGHSHPKVVQAIREQAEKIITCPEMFYNPVRAALLEKLTA
ncbi:MAG TPA: aminotransferase class III-fold pyridoxal phosphate-dependent enzyme, partial [Chloroflexi bacterium]|nr:aminotransferase class III-fold pyridoxal phosphate-dependent enzyme [Chloroflexota bacterium]